ncbi:MAG TPA: M48 family metalloprotease [Solirubrobacteraceae bacterium]|nr:M48 family metalloprotease [Solirubrobacteraceae bacterium]
MTISTAALGTRLRTWALVAGLTGLLLACGALIGGSLLWIFVIAAVAMNGVGYFFSDRIALSAAHARPLEPGEAPELHAMVRELASLAEVPVPTLHLISGAQANAFATGRDPSHAAIAVTEGLLQTVPAEQVRAVLAHEFGHIRNHDILVSSVAAMVAGAISAIAWILQLSFLFGSSDEEGENPLAAFALMLIAPIGATLLQLAVSRQREYLADATAARMLGSGRPLAEALHTITADEQSTLQVNPATAPMYIVNPLRAQGLAGLFATHPPVRERIARLLSYEAARPAEPRRPAIAT